MATTTDTLSTPNQGPALPGAGNLFVIRAFTSIHDEDRLTRIYHGRCVAVDDTHIWYREVRLDGSLANSVTGISLADMARDKEAV